MAGYFSLTMGSVLRAEAPPKPVRGLPAYPVGMVLLARLAVGRREQGRGLGALLLAEALRKAVAAGAGMTVLAGELRRRCPDALLLDPEEVGFMLRDVVPAAPSGDLQDLPSF